MSDSFSCSLDWPGWAFFMGAAAATYRQVVPPTATMSRRLGACVGTLRSERSRRTLENAWHLFGAGPGAGPGPRRDLSSAIDPVEGHAGPQHVGPRVPAGLVSVHRADLAVAVRRFQAARSNGFAAQDQGERQAKQHQSSHKVSSFLGELSICGRTQGFLLAYTC